MVSRQAGACGRRASVCNPCGYAANPAAETEDQIQPGITFTSKKILQAAVVLLGFGMNLTDILQKGKQSLPIILATHLHLIADLLPLVQNDEGAYQNRNARGRWLFNLWSSAIAATAPVIDADDEEIAAVHSVILPV